MTTHTKPTPDQLADLVHRLSASRADATRDEWVKVGMAIYDADSSEYGFSLFDRFSQQSPKYNAANIRSTWRTFKPGGGVTVGSLIHWANEDDPPRSKAAGLSHQEDPNAYPAAHGCTWADFARWGVTRGTFRSYGTSYQGIRFPEGAGARWRLFNCPDGKWLPEQSGMQPMLWGLPEAVTLATQTNQPLVLVNGQASVIACHAHGVAAFCIPGGEGNIKGALERGLLDTLRSSWHGPITILLDGDETGRKSARAIAPLLRTAGYTVTLKALQLHMDAADHCRLHNGTSVAALQSLPDIPEAATQPPNQPTTAQTVKVSRTFVFKCVGEDEAGDAQLLAELYRDRLCYDVDAGVWYAFAGHVWTAFDGQPRRLVWSTVAAAYLAVAAELQGEAAAIDDADPKHTELTKSVDRLLERAKRLRSLRRTSNVLTLAQELLSVKGTQWDANPWVLALENGVLDLRTGQLRAGRPDDYLRLVAPTAWAGLDAPAPRWERFVSEVLSDELDRVAFLQRLLGFSLNGTTKEHVLAVCVGERGRNGKRVLFEALQHVLGPYAGSISTDVLIGQDRGRGAGQAQPHLMDLQGRRIAYASETGEHDQLSASQVKNITGGDPITARHLHQNLVTFMPSHTIFLQTNRKPQAPADDDALWERVKVLEFKVRFVDEPQADDERPRDPDLEDALRAEAAGILAWLVQGHLTWQISGLRTPESVKVARDKYRQEESIDPFLEGCCTEWDGGRAEGGALCEAYKQWSELLGLRAKSAVWLGKELIKRFEKGRIGSGDNKGRTVYHGVTLRSRGDWTVEISPHVSTTLHQPINPSLGIRTPYTTVDDVASEGLEPFSKSSMHFFPHEEKNMGNPSNPSLDTEKTAEFRTTKPSEGFEAPISEPVTLAPGVEQPRITPDRIAVDRGRVQELRDSGLSLAEAQRQAVEEARVTVTAQRQADETRAAAPAPQTLGPIGLRTALAEYEAGGLEAVDIWLERTKRSHLKEQVHAQIAAAQQAA